MADEVDTLMTIRGSLKTMCTDGIELVREAGYLAELYEQASIVHTYSQI